MPRGNPKYTADRLEDRLKEFSSELIDRIPSESAFEFWADRDECEWLKIGTSKLPGVKECIVSVRLAPGNINNVLYSIDGISLKLNHEQKEFDRRKVEYYKPFDHLSSIKQDSAQWFTELRALTMFAFVWCGYLEEFVDFKRGQGFKALVDVFSRIPDKRASVYKKNASIDGNGDPGESELYAAMDPSTGTNPNPHSSTDTETHAIEDHENLDLYSTSEAQATAQSKRSHDGFLGRQKD